MKPNHSFDVGSDDGGILLTRDRNNGSNKNVVMKRFSQLLRPTKKTVADSAGATEGRSDEEGKDFQFYKNNNDSNSDVDMNSTTMEQISVAETVQVSNTNPEAAQLVSTANNSHNNNHDQAANTSHIDTEMAKSLSGDDSTPNKKGTWKKLKRLAKRTVGKTPPPSSFGLERQSKSTGSLPGAFPDEEHHQTSSQGNDEIRKSHSDEAHHEPQQDLEFEAQALMDRAIRGRLDGLDIVCLGPVQSMSISPRRFQQPPFNVWEPTTGYSFAGVSTVYSPKDMIYDMIWRSSVDEQPEMVLDGFFRDDRWTVKIDAAAFQKRDAMRARDDKDAAINSKTVSPTTVVDLDDEIDDLNDSMETAQSQSLYLVDSNRHHHSLSRPNYSTTDKDVSNTVPLHELWHTMWGKDNAPPPIPYHMSSVDVVGNVKDDMLQIAAACSVPVDLDEETFIICNDTHLQEIHNLASVPLKYCRFDDALAIFEKILKGLRIREDNQLKHIEGVTLHNMGVILMWQGEYSQALRMFKKALAIRRRYLPRHNPAISVTLVREGLTYFALNRMEEAVNAFEEALFSETDEIARAKILNNRGAARYRCGDDVGAMNDFMESLLIQRLLLQGRVQRKVHVLDASVMLSNIGKIHIQRGDYKKSLSVFEEALMLQTSVFGKDHRVVLNSLVSLALARSFHSQLLKAGQIFNGVLRSCLARLGTNSAEVVETTGAIGSLHFELKNYEDSLQCLTVVQKWQKIHLSPTHPARKMTDEFLERLEREIPSVWV